VLTSSEACTLITEVKYAEEIHRREKGGNLVGKCNVTFATTSQRQGFFLPPVTAIYTAVTVLTAVER
jgi:hypothetical protein